MKLFIALLLGILMLSVLVSFSGCAAVSELPSMKYCSDVMYKRTGLDIVIAAECKAPIGSSGL